MAKGPLSLGGLTVGELAKRVWGQLYADSAWDTAAQLGYYFMLAFFPLVLFLGSVVTVLHALNIVDPAMEILRRLMPLQAFALLKTELDRVTAGSGSDALTFGALAAIWASSSGVEALLNALNRAYEVKETRSYVKVRGTAIVMTLAIVVMIIAGGALLAFGDRIALRAEARFDRPWVTLAAVGVNYALGLLAITLGLEVVYYFGPNVANQKWRWVSPGSFVGVALFVIASSGFSLYVRYSNSYSAMYGSIGAVVIMLLWLYILGLALLIGGEINAQVAAAARAHGEIDAPMVGVEAEPEKPSKKEAEAAAEAAPPEPAVEDPVRELLEALRRESGHARAALATALGTSGPAAEAAGPDLTTMLEDEHPAVRDAAARALEQIKIDTKRAESAP